MAARRPLAERVAVRFPALVRGLLAVASRLPPLRRLVWRPMGRLAVAAINRRDLDGLVAVACEPDLVGRAVGFPVGMPESWHGHAGLVAFFAHWEETMGWPVFEVGRTFHRDDRLILLGGLESRGHLSGVVTRNIDAGAVAHFSRRGRVAGMEFHWDWSESGEP